MYDFYKQVYEKLEQKEKYIEDYITSVHQNLSSLGSNEANGKNVPNNRNPPEAKNIILGSSIIGKLETDKTIPTDIIVHAYRGSTIEKLEMLKKYP